MRVYTPSEISELRECCENIWLFGDLCHIGLDSVSKTYMQQDKDRGVEELVRTYMAAGITADDLWEDARKRGEIRRKSMFPNQMKMARRFCEHHKSELSRKGIFQVYRLYRACLYGYNHTPIIGDVLEKGTICGSYSGCPEYIRSP